MPPQRARVFTIAGMDEIIMPLARLTVNYGFDIDGNPICDVVWDIPDSDMRPDPIIRAGLMHHLDIMEERYAYGEDD